jgi:hypothetical protein
MITQSSWLYLYLSPQKYRGTSTSWFTMVHTSAELTSLEQPPPPYHCDATKPNQYPHVHSGEQFLQPQSQTQPAANPRGHLQLQSHERYYQHSTRDSFALFEAGDRTFLNGEGLSDNEIRQEEAHVESTLQWIPPLSLIQPRPLPRLEVGSFLLI